MSETRVFAQQQNLGRTSDGSWVGLRATRDGSVFQLPWTMALLLEGRVFGFNAGTAETGIASAATYAAADPDIALDVPNLIGVIPLKVEIAIDAAEELEDAEVFGAVTTVGSAGTGGTAQTIYNLRTDAPIPSSCSAYSDNASTTDPTGGNYLEFFRAESDAIGTPANQFANHEDRHVKWTVNGALVAPVVVGVGSMVAYVVSATTRDYFATVIFAEIPESAIN